MPEVAGQNNAAVVIILMLGKVLVSELLLLLPLELSIELK